MSSSQSKTPRAPWFRQGLAEHVWQTKYRYCDAAGVCESTIEETWRRVAKFVAHVEPKHTHQHETAFYRLLENFRFLPGGRILAGAGTPKRVTLFNCFVMGEVVDSMTGIFDALKEGAITMQQGGGVGYDFSTLRPAGTRARGSGAIASGPVSFMQIWDAMCATILSTGARRGAMMATLRCDHPDIETFIAAKQTHGVLRHFNVSVLVSDDFVEAVRQDRPWPLVFPLAEGETAEGETLQRAWSHAAKPVTCRIHKVVSARALWDTLMKAAYTSAEPGVLFIDRINNQNNLGYRERISATNPCGELPLPSYGACNLGSLNLVQFVRQPFTPAAAMDDEGIRDAVATAVRFLDNVIDASPFPLAQQAEQARGSRRIGLGITGLADALVMLGLRYGGEPSLARARDIMKLISHSAYEASVELAVERGPFPFYEPRLYGERPFIRQLPPALRDKIRVHGIRNSHLLAIAPTGTISLLANNVSSGLEPIFSAEYSRRIVGENGGFGRYDVQDYAVAWWREGHEGGLPVNFVDAHNIAPDDHLAMQATLQPYVDSAISKTINIPKNYPFDKFKDVFMRAYDLGLKGVTVFRPNPVTEEVLTAPEVEQCAWCDIGRDSDA